MGVKCPPRNDHPLQREMLQGTLDLLILQSLLPAPRMATPSPTSSKSVQKTFFRWSTARSNPALHRLEDRGWIAGFWGTSENNRKARYYRLTAAGRKQLEAQTNNWDRLVEAVNRVLRPQGN